ncbi:4'-phosphopantetheinyl transferase family protein [Herminiimonas aquatilis]|uniref:4'-phosphopantetheinyl transferase family protein n=1 Tax=Herminiimonas aquatilis TaxID=345342 RepID=A0ABW2J1W3_9BURK
MSDDQLLPYVSWLTPDELQRYQRFLRPERQRQFLLGRILLRCTLGELLNITPSSISFFERPGHAPVLNLEHGSPGFSLSHSGPWVACAISEQSALGLDIELMDGTRDLLALAEQSFDTTECALLKEKEGAARVAAFYTLWSTKEARYKLASTAAIDSIAHCMNFPHTDISIVLCSELLLAEGRVRIFDNW